MQSYDVCECCKPLRLMERPTPQPKGTEVLLKVLAAGVCHSDLHIWDGYYELGGGKRLQLLERGIKLPLQAVRGVGYAFTEPSGRLDARPRRAP